MTRVVARPSASETASRAWVYLALLWLAGNSLRMTLLAVPPVLTAIHRSLRLDETTVGVLTGLPVLLLAAAAVPGSLLVARLGARRALIAGLTLVAVAGAARGIGPSTPLLLAATLVMGLGVAVSQPTLPSLVKEWFPRRVGLATAAYSNGLLVGEIAAAGLTAPLVLPLVGGGWPLDLAAWSLPVALTALGLIFFTAPAPRAAGAAAARWWPDWRSARTWRLGLILGGASTTYFGTNAFLPDFLKATHHAGLIAPALVAVNLVQLPASIVVALVPGRVVGRRWPLAVAGAATAVTAVVFPHTSGAWLVAGVGVLGLCSGLVLVLNLALPPLLTDSGDVHRLSAAMFTISYSCAAAGPLIGGAAWDITRIPATAFAPVIIGGLLTFGLALGLHLPREKQIA